MDKLIKKRVENDNVLYVGCCAGAIIAGQTLTPTFLARFYKQSRKHNLKNMDVLTIQEMQTLSSSVISLKPIPLGMGIH